MKHFTDFLQVSNPKIDEMISEFIGGKNAECDRKILRRRLIDGITYERLAEEFELSTNHITKNGEPPKEMLAIYNYEHKKQISRAAIIKQMIDEFQK